MSPKLKQFFKQLDIHVWNGKKSPREKIAILTAEKVRFVYYQLKFKDSIEKSDVVGKVVGFLFEKHKGNEVEIKAELLEMDDFFEFYELKNELNAAYEARRR